MPLSHGPVVVTADGESSFSSIQDAYDSLDHTGTITITGEYDESVEDFPVVLDGGPGTRIQGATGGFDAARATITNDSGNSTFVLNQGNNRMPNTTMRDLSILQIGGGSGIEVQNSSHNSFHNIHIDGNNTSTGVLWDFGTAKEDYGNNSQRLFYCTAEEGGDHGFELGKKAHDVRAVGCSALHCAGIGWFVNGPSSTSFRDGQLENCGENGARIRASKSSSVKDSYIEHNAPNPNLSPADIHVETNAVQTTISDNYFNGSDTGMPYAIYANGDHLTIRDNRLGSDYDYMAYVEGTDVDLHPASNFLKSASTQYADIQPVAQRVRAHGTIVGAGTNNGGNGDLLGVDTTQVDGKYPGDAAVESSVERRWSSSGWQ